MDVIRVFNNELSALYDVKPPISKAKMTQITKSAIKGIKFYKHIVQSVEKFIQKCRPEYKVPGLYVVDSIVRQSRHQFGADKDVFGPRFVKNINLTFQHLFKCNPDDRSKIIRVLNLWQKNAVFPIDVIQPLLDMGHPNSSSEWPSEPPSEIKESPHKSNDERHKSAESQSWKGWPQANDEPVSDNRSYAEMSTKNLEKFMKAEMSNSIKEDCPSHFMNQVKQEKLPDEILQVKFNKKLLEFDYSDEDEEEEVKNDDTLPITRNALALSMAQNLLSNPDLLKQLQQMQQTIQQNEALNSDPGQHNMLKPDINDSNYSGNVPSSPQQPPLPVHEAPHMPLPPTDSDKDDRVLPQPPPQDLDERSLAAIMAQHRPLPPTTIGAYPPTGVPTEGDKDDRILPEPTAPQRDLDERSLAAILAPLERGILPPLSYDASNMMSYQNNAPFPLQPPLPMMEPMSLDPSYAPALPPEQHLVQGGQADEDERIMYSMPGEPPLPPQDFDERATMMMSMDDRSKKERSRSRSGSRSRGRSGRHRSRSKSPRRKRSRSRSRSRKSSRTEERERIRDKELEREREHSRRKKGVPAIKKGCISVCSTTLWLGHVPKSCTEGDISDIFGEFGTILSIDMIPPRGCAFVVMDRRQDANKAIQKLKKLKLQSSIVKMAWAPGKGVKGKEYKEYWEVNAGVSYVPYEKISESVDALDFLEEGGFIDEDSLPENLKALRNQVGEKSVLNNNTHTMPMNPVTTAAFNTMHGPPMVPPPIIPPTTVNLPRMVLPHLMQPQFGLPMPGMLPPQAMVMQVPMGIPPPNPMLMVQQQSQSLLNPPSLQMGMPQMIPRAVPPVPSALQNLKTSEQAVNSPVIPAGDATPTDEDGTSVSSPSVVHMANSVSTSSIPVSSMQQSVAQFNSLMNLQNANRSMMSVPPPVSSSCTTIPYPPPNVSFSFPPPGVRPPGQLQAHQFPWMQQKPASSPFADADSSQSTNSMGSRATPQPGMLPHMFSNRPPFSDKPLTSHQPAIKETQDSSMERKSNDAEATGNRSSSPGHHDMVISTDDESSLDRDYQRNEINSNARFQGPTEFPRMPMGMHHMRGPPGPMQGMRFQRGGPVPFPMRMGGPRGMGMHPGQRMDMDFPMHSGPRMPGGPRRENLPQEGRDWYPRDYDGPPFDREKRYERDDWQRDSWGGSEKRESDSVRRSHDCEDADERRSSRNHFEEPRLNEVRDKRRFDSSETKEHVKPTPAKKSKPDKSLLDDMLKLNFYRRDKTPGFASQLNKKFEKKKEQSKDKPEQKDFKKGKDFTKQVNENLTPTNQANEMDHKNLPDESSRENLTSNSRKERDREARKRSRWGRTLSEEREFQQLKRSEIEMKFQSYEQQSQLQQSQSNETTCDNSSETNNTGDPEPVDNTSEMITTNTSEISTQNTSEMFTQNTSEIIIQNNSEMITQNVSEMITQNTSEMITQNTSEMITQNTSEMITQNTSEMITQNTSEMITQNIPEVVTQNTSEVVTQNASEVITESSSEVITRNTLECEDNLISEEAKTVEKVIEYSECETLPSSSETIMTNNNEDNSLDTTINSFNPSELTDTSVSNPSENDASIVPAES